MRYYDVRVSNTNMYSNEYGSTLRTVFEFELTVNECLSHVLTTNSFFWFSGSAEIFEKSSSSIENHGDDVPSA